jgi:hypothetical protein
MSLCATDRNHDTFNISELVVHLQQIYISHPRRSQRPQIIAQMLRGTMPAKVVSLRGSVFSPLVRFVLGEAIP